MGRTPRTRRSPEEARRLILDATLTLLARVGPDAIGLKDVAAEAGVSHALVTHYFGTFDALIEAAFADYTTRTRSDLLARLGSLAGEGPAGWVNAAAAHLAEPVYARLALWAMLSGRAEQADFFPTRERGLERVADALVAKLAADGRPPEREDVEFAMLLVLSALTGYAAAGRALWGSLGRKPSQERDAGFRERLADVVAHLAEGAHLRGAARAAPKVAKPKPRRTRGSKAVPRPEAERAGPRKHRR